VLYNWVAKSRQTGQPFEDQKLQQAEMARLIIERVFDEKSRAASPPEK
jgi:hypothetical protein